MRQIISYEIKIVDVQQTNINNISLIMVIFKTLFLFLCLCDVIYNICINFMDIFLVLMI